MFIDIEYGFLARQQLCSGFHRYQPGSTIRVGVSVSVIEDQQDRRYEEPQKRRY